MDAVKEFQCPACGAALSFAAGTDEVQCSHCGKSIPVSVLNTAKAEAESQGFEWGDYKKNLSEEHLENTRVYNCQSCGAIIETDATTAATKCPYCDSNVVLSDRVSGSLRPNAVLPFQIKAEQLPEIVKAFYKGKKLLPNNFFNTAKLGKTLGVYVPFWLYNCRLAGAVNLNGTIVTHYSDKDYDYTSTSHYLLAREGEMAFKNVPVDASVKMDNDLMDSIEPFDFSQMVKFNDAYLAGYVADHFDSSPDDELPRADARMRNSISQMFADAESGYTSVSVKNNAMKMVEAGVQYVLLPVYLINCEYGGKKYQYAVNGQTGKIVGELPISKAKAWGFFFRAFAIVGAIAFAVCTLLQ